MMYITFIFSNLAVIAWQMWWLSLAVSLIVIVATLLLYKVKKSRLKHETKALQQRITEYAELLDYAKENEQKTKESIDISNRLKIALLSKLSHEIRTPMNGVIGMASLLAETELTDEQKEYTDMIIQSSERLMTTMNNMLVTDVINYTENETDRTVCEETDYDLRNNIETVLESFAAKAAQTGVELIYSIGNKVPEMLVGDEMRLQQILMHLVENALRFTSEGEITITVNTLRLLEGSQADLAFEIRDTGIGMPATDVELLSKDIADINTTKEGNALPLIICKKLVTLMGGQLEIETKKDTNAGTIIRFKIRTRISLQPQRATAKMDTAMRNKTILLVDDNDASRNAMKKQLEQWDITPATAASVKEAMSIFTAHPHFDLIITDMEMPRMNGIELAKEIKEINPKTSLVLLNTYGNEQYKNHPGMFKSVITKPVKHQVLYDCLTHELTKTEVIPANQNKPKVLSELGKQYPLRILVAEDNKTNQDVALKFLSKLGYEAALAQNGEEALEMVGDGNYDLIFMDVQMPVKDGLEATRLIRLCLSTQPVIIAMTANAIQGDRQKCLNAGMDDYISKPFRMEDLIKMIEKWAVQINIK